MVVISIPDRNGPSLTQLPLPPSSQPFSLSLLASEPEPLKERSSWRVKEATLTKAREADITKLDRLM